VEKTKVVGIGASAGGFEAIQKLLSNLEPNSDLAFIIAQHLDPSQPTMLVNLLSKSITIPIQEAQDGEYIEPNRIYICPPNKNITLLQNRIILTPPTSKIFPKPSIDTFFSSLAKDKEENAIGIILSGSGSDGAVGIKAIKNAGGITIVQDEKSAKYSSMPRASIETGSVDAVLTPAIIGKELQSIISAPNIFFVNENAPRQLDAIYDILIERLGTDFTDYKINTIQRRIHRRMAVNKIESLDEYVEHLKNSNKESKLLYKDLLVIVTSFFRDTEAFDSLKVVIKNIVLAKTRGESIRIWVPGCATGEEVFSIAMLLHQELVNQEKISTIKVQIFATDISEEAIAQARSAKYFKEEIIHIPQELIDNYLIVKDDYYEISKNIRDMVVFSQHDLIKDPPFINLDLLSCRNLLIYFNSTLQKRLFAVFHHALRHKGYLFLGKSESTSGLTNIFATIDSKWKIFQREETLNPPNLDYLQYYPKRYPSTIKVTEPKLKPILDKDEIMSNAVSSSIAHFFAKNYLIIDKENAIIYTSGNIKHYFDIPIGKMTNDILAFANEEIRIDLRAAIYKCRREQKANTQKIRTSQQPNEKYYISVLPMPNTDYFNDALLVMFSEIENDETPPKMLLSSEDKYEIEHELMVTKERLQTTIEELETSNEELQSTNEELQSANEELRSTNEELETSNEELQSSNEELSTVNDELEIKSRDLRISNDDLNNAFSTIEYGVMFVDKSFRIRRYTPFMKNIFVLRDGDMGNLITSIECKINFPELRKHLEFVIHQGEVKSFEFDEEGIRYFCKIEPFYNEHERVSGASIIFHDTTEIHQNEMELKRYKNELEKLVEEKVQEIQNSNYELSEAQKIATLGNWSLDIVKNNLQWSDEIYKIFEIETKDFDPSYEFFLDTVHPEDKEAVHQAYSQSIKNKTPYEIRHRIVLSSGKIKHVLEKGNTVYNKLGEPILSRGIVQDITKEVELQNKALEEKAKYQKLLDNATEGIYIMDLQGNLLDFSKQAASMLGYTKEELSKLSVYDWEVGVPKDKIQETLDGLTPIPITAHTLHKRKDGSTFDTSIMAAKVNYGGQEAIYSTVRDITQIKKHEQEILKQKEEFETIFKISKDPIAILDLKSNFLDFNDAYLEVTGYSRQELLDTSCIELSIPQDYEESKKVIRKVVKKGFVKNFEKSCYAKDGDIITVNMSLSLMPDKKRIIVSAKDITQNRKLQDALKELNKNLAQKVQKKVKELREQEQLLIQQSKLAAMGEMIGSIAHQWRQPLNLLSIKKDLLILSFEKGELDESSLMQYNKSFNDTIQYMSKTIDDFRNFFKPSKEKSNFDIVKSITDTVHMIDAQLKQQGIELRINCTEDTQQLYYYGYPSEFKQVIINLIKNAQDIIKEKKIQGQIEITIKHSDTTLTIEIEDNGGGIEEKIFPKIFEPYFTTKFQSQGTGLGLYMSKTIIERNMGGKLEAKNRKNGALFTITLRRDHKLL
jgi:two-component system CheB/CheR fusion protein